MSGPDLEGDRPTSAGGEPDPTVVPVVVVGAGPTGLVAASLLAEYGVSTLVLERFDRPYPLPRAVHMDDEVVRILQQIGVAGPFAEISRPALGLRLLDARHRVMAEFRREPVGRHGYPQANLFDQPDLELLLRAGIAARPEVTVCGGTEVVSIEHGRRGSGPGPAPVLVTTRDVATGRRRQILASAVLGCDGANSLTRRAIGARLEDLRFEERWLVLDGTCAGDLDTWAGIHQICDPHRAATFMRIGPSRYRWEFRLRAGESVADLTAPGPLAALLAPWLGTRSPAEVEIVRSAEYTFRAKSADRWSQGRIFLLGDAAHLTPPFIGQGLGAGLRDAHNLAWKLARVLREGADERLLSSYEAERKPHARRMIRLAVAVGWAMTGGQDRAAFLRRYALAVLCRLPWTRARLSAATVPRLAPGPLVRRRLPGRRLDRLSGDTCPQPWIAVAGRRQRLDAVLGTGFALLSDGPADPELLAVSRRLRARHVDLTTLAEPTADPAAWSGGEPVRRWLRDAGATAVLLRPDRVVLVAAPAPSRLPAPGWAGRGPAGLDWLLPAGSARRR